MSFHFEARIDGDTRVTVSDMLKEIAEAILRGQEAADADGWDVDYKWSITEQEDDE